MTRMIHRFAFAIFLAVTVAACGDDEPAPPADLDAGVPLCVDLGCPTALCNRAGDCVCTPPGEDPIACRGGGPH